ncbi:hypothetical protein ANO14919_059200 [Xylariales sp. No.14919]|nr:hypothetical protein ANO14919_059200 [Xylariales sp. No.14919]
MLAIATRLELLFAGGLAFVMSGMSSMNDKIDLQDFDVQKHFDSFRDSGRTVSRAWGSGVVGMVVSELNIAIFSALWKADKAVGHSAYFQRKITTIASTCVAMILVIEEIIMAKALGHQGSALLGGHCGITSLAATFTVLSVVADIVKKYPLEREDADEDELIGESHESNSNKPARP